MRIRKSQVSEVEVRCESQFDECELEEAVDNGRAHLVKGVIYRWVDLVSHTEDFDNYVNHEEVEEDGENVCRALDEGSAPVAQLLVVVVGWRVHLV